MKKVEVEIPDGKCAKWVKGVLTLVDEEPQDITERIKTFEDACNILGDEHPLVTEYKLIAGSFDITNELLAYLKLRIIAAALNEGWEPTFDKDESRWYPWFTNGYGGIEYSHASCAGSGTGVAVRLAFKSKELAKYAAKQFIDIYKDFCYGRNKL